MLAIVSEFLNALGLLLNWILLTLVPSNITKPSMVHVAIWVPVFIALLGFMTTTIRGWGRPKREATAQRKAAQREEATAQREAAQREAAQREEATAQREAAQVVESQREAAQREEATAQRKAAQVATQAQKAQARTAQRKAAQVATQAQKAQARTAQREAAKVATQAQKAQARAAQRAEATAQREAAKVATQAQKDQARTAQRAEATAQREAAKVATQAQKAQARAAQRAEATAQREAAKVATQAQRTQKTPRTRTARPKANTTASAQRDPTTRAFGSDPTRVYEFRYRVVGLDELITSNTDSGSINPAYDPALQPRNRQRAASQRQIEQAARNLVPEALLWDFRALDKGAPIVGDDLQVESGNGRALALRQARLAHPERWAAYQDTLKGQLAAVGLNESDIAGVESPVLVRERVTVVADRAAFAREANAPPVLQMSTLETAVVDSSRISSHLVSLLAVKEGQTIDQALRAKSNSEFVREFVGTLSENEAALLQRKDGTLAQSGIRRIKAALFVHTFEGAAGERLAEVFLESLDSDIKNFETALSASLPVLARAEHLIATGERAKEMSMTEDISRSLDMLSRLREQGADVGLYVDQSNMFGQSDSVGRETTPFQDQLLLYFDEIGRKPKQVREFLESYAAAVEAAPSPLELDMFGAPTSPTKEQIFERISKRRVAVAA